jgi:hypothetical protein
VSFTCSRSLDPYTRTSSPPSLATSKDRTDSGGADREGSWVEVAVHGDDEKRVLPRSATWRLASRMNDVEILRRDRSGMEDGCAATDNDELDTGVGEFAYERFGVDDCRMLHEWPAEHISGSYLLAFRDRLAHVLVLGIRRALSQLRHSPRIGYRRGRRRLRPAKRRMTPMTPFPSVSPLFDPV